jgi:hypothetical protein
MNLSFLFFLACPISMGLMMWMMMRGGGNQGHANPDSRIDALEAEIHRLRAENGSQDANPEEPDATYVHGRS